MRSLFSRLDSRLYRYPFEGWSARHYARSQRSGFGDLDERLIRRWHAELARARTALDVGSGPGTFATRLARDFPDLRVVTCEPSADFAGAAAGALRVRGRAEALPLADGSIDVTVCLCSLRHVTDRAAAFRELRRVCAPAGVAYVVELDPTASRARIRAHSRGIRAWASRLCFGPLVVRTSPQRDTMIALARDAGWQCTDVAADDEQPLYILRLVP